MLPPDSGKAHSPRGERATAGNSGRATGPQGCRELHNTPGAQPGCRCHKTGWRYCWDIRRRGRRSRRRLRRWCSARALGFATLRTTLFLDDQSGVRKCRVTLPDGLPILVFRSAAPARPCPPHPCHTPHPFPSLHRTSQCNGSRPKGEEAPRLVHKTLVL